MNNLALVVIGYNRPNSIKRLLKSLDRAEYQNKKVDLIISLDNSGDYNVLNEAENFQWIYGEKQVIVHSERLGLRKHVLFCGNLTKDYDAIVMFEDDIYASPNFFNYVCATLNKYQNEEKVAGISLYTHLWNVGVNRPFYPQKSEYDVFFLQYAQSWGQVWTKKMWDQFMEWYGDGTKKINESILPTNIANWPESSWLKYFINYIVEKDKYFVYPYESMTTNFTDTGTHNTQSSTSYQVPLAWNEKFEFNLPNFNIDQVVYDVYFERENIGEWLGVPNDELCIDLYGLKRYKENKRYLLSTEICPFEIKDSFALSLRPHELNIIADIKGNEIFLYDTFSAQNNKNNNELSKNNKILIIKYDLRAISNRKLLFLLMHETSKKFKNKLLTIFSLK